METPTALRNDNTDEQYLQNKKKQWQNGRKECGIAFFCWEVNNRVVHTKIPIICFICFKKGLERQENS